MAGRMDLRIATCRHRRRTVARPYHGCAVVHQCHTKDRTGMVEGLLVYAPYTHRVVPSQSFKIDPPICYCVGIPNGAPLQRSRPGYHRKRRCAQVMD